MNKAELHLTKCPLSGKVIVPPGTSLADLHFVWECQQAAISRLSRIYDRSRRTNTEQEHLEDAIARLALLTQAIYEAEIESTDDIERLAQVDGRRVPDVAFDGGCSLGDALACVLAKAAGAYAARHDNDPAPVTLDQAA